MSSHHFVKEGQEPALLIIDPFSLDPIEPLLEWAPLVIVCDQALDEVLRWGFKIDIILTPFAKTAEITERVAHQMPLTIIHNELSETAVTTALLFLTEKKQSSVNIIAENAEAVIRSLGERSGGIDISVLSPTIRWSSIIHGHYAKWLPSNSALTLKTSGEVEITLNGRDLNSETIKQSVDTDINISEDGILSVVSKSGFWIGERY